MVSSVAPFWDGNETWLVLGGGGLWVAFPQAYAVVMPAMYLPVIMMLLALVFRGVAFEFRTVARTSKNWWNAAFWLGSTLAGFFQGMILGGLIQGIAVANGEFAGGPLDWATPFAFVCGLGVVTGYALLGATWLVMKTEGDVANRARELAKRLIPAVLAFMGESASGRHSRSKASPNAGSVSRTSCFCGQCRWSPASLPGLAGSGSIAGASTCRSSRR